MVMLGPFDERRFDCPIRFGASHGEERWIPLNIRHLFRLTGLLLMLSMQSVSQDVSGRISGTVKDASGAVVTGATVTAFHLDRDVAVRTVRTSEGGGYNLSLLPVGHYRLTAQSTGFKTT